MWLTQRRSAAALLSGLRPRQMFITRKPRRCWYRTAGLSSKHSFYLHLLIANELLGIHPCTIPTARLDARSRARGSPESFLNTQCSIQ
eukprot:IDg4235t1